MMIQMEIVAATNIHKHTATELSSTGCFAHFFTPSVSFPRTVVCSIRFLFLVFSVVCFARSAATHRCCLTHIFTQAALRSPVALRANPNRPNVERRYVCVSSEYEILMCGYATGARMPDVEQTTRRHAMPGAESTYGLLPRM